MTESNASQDMTSQVDSPLKDAYANYRAMRSSYRSLSAADRQMYFTFQRYRNVTKYWDRNKARLVAAVEPSLESARATLVDYQEFEAWYASGATAHLGRIAGIVSRIEQAIDTFGDDEDTVGNIKDSFFDAAEELGLVPFDGYTEDGFAWFEDEEGERYFTYLAILNGPYNPFNVLSVPVPKSRPRLYTHTDLFGPAIALGTVGGRHPAKILDDYFGYYNSKNFIFEESLKTESVARALSSLRYYQKS